MSDANCHRVFLVTYPRTASNLLIRILNLPNQLKIYTPNALAGYLFTPAAQVIRDSNAWAAPLDSWPDGLADRLKQIYRDGFVELEKTASKGADLGRTVFVKEHIQGLLHPLAQQRFVFGNANGKVPIKSEDLEQWDFSTTVGEVGNYSALNDTVLPDETLESWKPIFLIRHPALSFPSFYRIFRVLEGDEDDDPSGGRERWLDLYLTLHFTRRLYELYCAKDGAVGNKERSPTKTADEGEGEDGAHDGPRSQQHLLEWPIVLDADDIITAPVIVERLARQIGMDVSNLKFKWDATSVEERKTMSALMQTMLSTLLASDGVQVAKAAGQVVDVEVEKKKWETEWGESKARKLERWVQAAMADYLFLSGKRMR
ncbi:hypothetical protein G647_03955 [Cladophialophora carrionii CBS 160.54]|uniref:Sulfotransferase domain-containing protein n=1 Tax=Cladophialophora carrionii CBS 160.54 TaxID=1279043 RepID=V9DD26_9EURO|nr:uncharacterized protein G647_03955 [Cladophialophora carrionii CBS 160.54]ETI24586.1 hypothetical protein G647_03955 [Cladophialophora carrionii CBS 160.54]